MTSIASCTVGRERADVGRRARDQVAREGLVGQLQSLPRATPRPDAVGRATGWSIGVDREAELAQVVGHARGSGGSGPARKSSSVASSVGVGVVEPVAEDVQVLVLGVDGRELHRRHQFDVLTRAASSASATPSTVSWSVSANSVTPASAARATTSAGGSEPSECVECDWRSNVGGGFVRRHRREAFHQPHRRRFPMTTGAIIAIVVVALIIIAVLAFVLPRMRARARVQKRERELAESPRGRGRRAPSRGRDARAPGRRGRAARADRPARSRGRACAGALHEERAGLHEKGMADHELIDDSERDKFAGTSAMSTRP